MEEDSDEGHFEAEDQGGDADGQVAVGQFRAGVQVAARVEEGEEGLLRWGLAGCL